MRRSESQWRALIEEQASSGLTAAEFCRQQSLNPKYFSTRKRQLSSKPASAFVQVKPSVAASPKEADQITIRVIEFTVTLDHLSKVLSDTLR